MELSPADRITLLTGFLVGLVGMFVPEYGEDFFEVFADLYP
jgi:hypothetical protein